MRVTSAWRLGHWTRWSSAQTAIRNCTTRGRSLCSSASSRAAPAAHRVAGLALAGRAPPRPRARRRPRPRQVLLVRDLPVLDLLERLLLGGERSSLEDGLACEHWLAAARVAAAERRRRRRASTRRESPAGRRRGPARAGLHAWARRRGAGLGARPAAPAAAHGARPGAASRADGLRATGSAGFLVRRVLAAPAAVLAELDPVRIVPLLLLGLVVAPLALLACEGHGDSNVSASHGSLEG